MLPIISKSKIWYVISGTLVVASIAALLVWGLRFGIDFTGGSLLSVEFTDAPRCYMKERLADGFRVFEEEKERCEGENVVWASGTGRPQLAEILEILGRFSLGEVVPQFSGERAVNLRFREVSEQEHKEIVSALKEAFPDVEERRFEAIGSIIGKELKVRSFWALGAVLLFISLFIAWSFRKVSRPVPSWQYGITAIIALFHDVVITLGVFSALGHYSHIEVGAPFIAAILTVLAYSVSDTIVVFDRVRENLFRMHSTDFAETVNASVNETMRRSFNTSVTILLSLAAIFFFGGDSIKYFALTLIIGISAGTYSSIFLASPILVTWQKFQRS